MILGVALVPETFAPRLLQKKAHDLRFRTGRWALHSRLDMEDTSIIYFLEKNLTRPLKMLFTEPILLCVCTYNAFTLVDVMPYRVEALLTRSYDSYGVLCTLMAIIYHHHPADSASADLLFGAVPIIFEEGRGWNTLVGSLPFIGVFLGCVTGAAINLIYGTQFYVKRVDAANGPVPPELRRVDRGTRPQTNAHDLCMQASADGFGLLVLSNRILPARLDVGPWCPMVSFSMLSPQLLRSSHRKRLTAYAGRWTVLHRHGVLAHLPGRHQLHYRKSFSETLHKVSG